MSRITSYNVCYTKLLRASRRQGRDDPELLPIRIGLIQGKVKNLFWVLETPVQGQDVRRVRMHDGPRLLRNNFV